MKPKPHDKKEPHIVDWLKDQRQKNRTSLATETDATATRTIDWQRELTGNGNISMKSVLERAKGLEEKAQRKQKLMSITKGKDNIDDMIAVNEMYVESIRAKLHLLNVI